MMDDKESTTPSYRQVQFDFSTKHVLVTGASRGIGLAVAAGFCAAGARVSVLADDDTVHDVAADLSSTSSAPITGYCCDISNVEQVDKTVADLDSIDVLINNAGIEKATPVINAKSDNRHPNGSDDVFRRIIDVNVMGNWYMSRAVATKMADGANMVFTCSIWSRTAVADYSAYCASKHAVLGFMRSLAHELAPRNIRVNGVCPGWVRTQASMQSLEHMSAANAKAKDEMLSEIIDAQLLDGLMIPADLVSTYLFLASDAASNITGQAFTVDRGEVLA